MTDEKKQLLKDYLATFDLTVGKNVLEDLSRECFENRECFDSDPYKTAYRAGKRSVILYIRRQLSKNPYEEKQTHAR